MRKQKPYSKSLAPFVKMGRVFSCRGGIKDTTTLVIRGNHGDHLMIMAPLRTADGSGNCLVGFGINKALAVLENLEYCQTEEGWSTIEPHLGALRAFVRNYNPKNGD